MKAIRHFITITHHKILVMQGCFRIGLYKQGLLHDMSKYSPTEFLVGCRYYKGYMSPNNAERADRGYSSAWLHHKGRNKHHLEYWIDYAVSNGDDKAHTKMEGMKMPIRYVCEMFIDRVSASKNYQKEKYTDKSALEYYEKSVDHYMIHPDTKAMLEYLLVMLSVKGEEYTYRYIKKEVLKGHIPYEKDKINQLEQGLHV
jgi:hypothetical protein